MSDSIIQLSSLITLSASRLKTFNTCHRQYRYKYIDKLPQDKTQALALGSSIHRAVELGFKEPKRLENKTLLAMECYNEQLMEHGLYADSKVMKDVIKMLENYDFDTRKPNQLEMEFTLPFPNAAAPLCYVNGYLDQVYDQGFIDMKSNKRKPEQWILDNDLQFIIYDWAFTEIFGYDPTMRIWQHLRTGEELDADVSGKIDLAEREVEKILEAQVTGIYDKHVGEWCKWCLYQEPCLGKVY